MKFSDLHTHNHMRAHFWMQENPDHFERKGSFSPWTVISSNRKGYLKGKMGASYSQADLVKAWNAKVRLSFNSLYPLERQFVKGYKPVVGEDKWYRFLIGFATSHKLPLRDLIQTAYMRIPDEAVDYFQSKDYDYWESLQREMAFVTRDSGKRIAKNEIFTPGLFRRIFESEKRRRAKLADENEALNAQYLVPTNRKELLASLDNEEEITMVLTVEGAHALGTDRASIAEISRRVQTLKTDWKTPVFFITFAHHFDNSLCGHAHSIPDVGKLLLDQRKNRNAGFNANGLRIARELLGLNKALEKDETLGYRILLDVKHMSAQSRKDYYEHIVLPCLQKGDVIPVIGSHCGYSGRKSLDQHIALQDSERDDYCELCGDESKLSKTKRAALIAKQPKGKFNAWNINLCDEDIELILKTGGLFGLSFDQRILGLKSSDAESRNGIELLWDNIDGIAKSAYANPNLTDVQKASVWKCMTIGTDYEGLIDPPNPYPSVLEFPLFAGNLIFEIEKTRKKPDANHLHFLQSREDSERLVADFCFRNAENFVKQHFPK
ncbi:amidohydrolase family protein [Algoriphagus namhaensis]